MMSTQTGRDGSRRYNSKLRLDTIRHAIIDQLREPPKGFEEVTKRHFSMCRSRIVAQARRWMLEARGSPLEVRFARAYGQLLSLLSEDSFGGCETLSPLKEDLAYLGREDPNFARGQIVDMYTDRKPAAVVPSVSNSNSARDDEQNNKPVAVATGLTKNPWGILPGAGSDATGTNSFTPNPWLVASSPHHSAVKKDDQDDDDDDDFYS
jgi:hypothetical protein